MKTEFFWRTSRNASSMVFFDKDKAIAWRTEQKEKHGARLAPAALIERIITVQEIIHDNEIESPTEVGSTVLQESADTTNLS